MGTPELPAIEVKGISKLFRLPREKSASIKSSFINMFKGKKGYDTQRVLKDISLEVRKGEFFGIVGRNGSGKSTLLKLLAGIYTPDQGEIITRGNITPFIELGVGFNPELTGRDNVFLNGSLLGFSRKEMEAMYDEIVEFAELEKFMGQKLKNYSSGMQVRLAFSIAIRANTEILILDEVLAVGDEAFQQKCIDVFERYQAQQKTIILVTHDMEMVKRFCTRAVLIDNGKITFEGAPKTIAREYSDLNLVAIEKDINKRNKEVIDDSNIKLKISNAEGKQTTKFRTHDKLHVEASWDDSYEQKPQNIGIAIHKTTGEYVFGTNTVNSALKLTGNQASYDVELNVGPGTYYIVVGLFAETGSEVIDFMPRGPDFIVQSDAGDYDEGLTRLKNNWKIK